MVYFGTDNALSVSVGDSVTVTGEVSEFTSLDLLVPTSTWLMQLIFKLQVQGLYIQLKSLQILQIGVDEGMLVNYYRNRSSDVDQ